MRPVTTLTLMAACASGLYLYSAKHRAELLDREIAHVVRQTDTVRQRTGLLRAEWALLNEPSRLQGLADRYLQLKPMAPTQFVRLSELAAHLPPVQTEPVADPNLATDEDAASPATPATPPATGDVVAGSQQTPPAAQAAQAAAPATPPAAPPVKVAQSQQKHAPRRTALASRTPSRHAAPDDNALAQGTPLPLASPRPMGASVLTAMAHPGAAAASRPRPAIVSAAPAYVPPASIASALGGRGALPPPVPLGSGAQ